MRLDELFGPDAEYDVEDGLREDLVDLLTPLAANRVPYVTVSRIIELLRDKRTGMAVDRILVMRLLSPQSVKIVAKIEGDRIYLKLPSPEQRDIEAAEAEAAIERIEKTAQKQAKKNIDQRS